MSRRTGPDQATAQAVAGRQQGMCLRCNERPGSQIHHRQPRQMGGTRDPRINLPSNLVWICEDCHRHIESHRSDAYADGWLIRRGADPASQCLITPARMVIVLDSDGGYYICPMPDVPAVEVPF